MKFGRQGWDVVLFSDPAQHPAQHMEDPDNSALHFVVCIRCTYLGQVSVGQEAGQVACLQLVTTHCSHKVRFQPFSGAPSTCWAYTDCK